MSSSTKRNSFLAANYFMYKLHSSSVWCHIDSNISHVGNNKSMLFSVSRATVNELQNLHYLPRTSERRETLIEDRTRCHADHVGQGFDRQTTAAVGIIKGVHTQNET